MSTLVPLTPDLEPLWAVYGSDGTVLTTLDNAGDGSYWAYKRGLKNTTVGPYPDRGRLMLPVTDPCEDCAGTGHNPHSQRAIPLDDDGEPRLDRLGYEVDTSRQPEGVTECPHCRGHGWLGRNGAYRSPAALKAARTKGTAKVCDQYGVGCLGKGTVVYMPILEDCYSCKGAGARPAWDVTRPILPPHVSDCDTATDAFIDAWLADATITVARSGRGLSWGEAHLGFMGLGSCVDYGRSWDQTDDQIIDNVVDGSFLRHTQFIKMIDRRTRVVGTVLLIEVTRNGYTVMVVGGPVFASLGSLPPTYFPTVFEEV